MKIGRKLTFGYAMLVFLVAIGGYIGIRAVDDIQHLFNLIMSDNMPAVQSLGDLKLAGLRIVSSTSEFGFVRTESVEADRKELESGEEDLIQSGVELYERSLDQYEELIDQSSERELLSRIKSAGQRLQQISSKIIGMKKALISGSRVLEQKEEFEKAERDFLKVIDDALATENREALERTASVEATIGAATNATLIIGLLALVAAIAIGAYNSHSISNPIRKLKSATHRISEGHLDTDIAIKSKDEVGELADSFNKMTADLRRFRLDIVSAKDFADNVIKSMSNSLVVLDIDLALTRANQATLDLLGYEESELIGKSIRELLAEDEQPDASALAELIEKGFIQSVEKRYAAKDGRTIPVSCSGSILRNAAGEAQGFVWVAQDITARKDAEAALEQARDAALESARLKSEFLANMSHEIRTPMNGIMGMTELALDTELSAEQREYLGLVQSSATALLTIINDILDFSKIDAGRLDFDHADFNLRDTLANVMRELAPRAHAKELELTCCISMDVPEALKGDPGRLRQVIVNLVGNAIKFTESGEVTLRVQTQSQTGDETTLHFSVTDTGIGIPEEQQALIFEAFTQADGSIARKYGGTGLGLAISARIIEMMGGSIWVESPVNSGPRNAARRLNSPDFIQSEIRNPESAIEGGSAFHFTTRFGLQQKLPANQTAIPVILKDLRVLIVDDNATNRRMLEETLTHWNMNPAAVESGRAALNTMKQAQREGRPVQLVLLDSLMPDMDGFEVAEHIRNTPALVGATIMMLTSNRLRGDAERCGALGISSYLVKPITQSNLLDAIIIALNEQPPTGESRAIRTPSIKQSARSLSVLLAEDNSVNQKLVIGMLEKRGHKVAVACNGKEALDVLEAGRFDVVLMDVQMPEMSGFEATAEIRKMEQSGAAHTPIIALTAHAMKGDRERCLNIGMDGYLSKPIQSHELFEAIESALSRSTEATRTNATAPEQMINRSAIVAQFDGDGELMQAVVDQFRETAEEMLSRISNSIQAGDGPALERAAHNMKGAAATLHARAAVEQLRRLEQMGREANLSRASEAFSELERELGLITPLLLALVKEFRTEASCC